MAPQQQPQPERADQPQAAAGPDAPAPPPGAAAASAAETTGSESGDATDGGEIRAAERSALRAEAVAATEDFHPLRLRPYVAYVAEPGGEPAESKVRPLIAVHDDGDGPATTDLGLFPAMYSGLEYAEEEPVPPYAEVVAAAHGRHRRRKRGLVVAAAAVAGSALAAGAVAVTGQVTGGGERGATDLALPDTSTSMPDVTLPADAAPATGHAAPPVSHRAGPATTGPAPSASPSASPATTIPGSPGSPAARPPATARPSATATAALPTGTPVATLPGPTGAPATTAPTLPPLNAPVTPSSPDSVLRLGDSGPDVADLQRRLSDVWLYHGRADGDFDQRTEHAVAMFQTWYGVQGDPSGVYGPNTRTALERRTAWN